MKILVIVPKVVQSFLSQFPETTRNAYPYFNYDHRVVNERVNRGDVPSQYKGPDQFTDADYHSLVTYARSRIDPILAKYSARVAAEDALNIAIRSFGNGQFDGKVNASKFSVLMEAMLTLPPAAPAQEKAGPGEFLTENVLLAKKEKKPESVSPKVLKQLGVKPKDVATRFVRQTPYLMKTDEGIVLHKKGA